MTKKHGKKHEQECEAQRVEQNGMNTDSEAGKKAGEDSAAAFMQGVVMIRNGLSSLLESKYGLQYYEVQGKAFNPDIHEAVATNPSAEVTEPTVGAELQKGYKLKERILRPAKVMVLMPAPAEEK